jgi:hypothetical protein
MPAMAGLDNQDKDKESEDVVVFEGEDELQDKGADSGGSDKDDGGDGDDDRRLVRGEGNDDAEERRLRNRESRQQRKQRHRKLWEENRQLRTMVEGYQKSLGELNTRLSTIEEGGVESVGRRLDASLVGAERALEAAKADARRAMTEQDADALVSANERIAQITVDRQRIADDKRAFEERRAQARDKKDDDKAEGGDKNGIDPRRVEFERTMLRNASIFQRRNSWYDHDNDDEDTETVKKLDAEVASEGFNPASRDYWEELETRMKEALPHRFKKANGKGRDDDGDEGDDEGDRKVISMGSGRQSNKGGAKDYFLSKPRVQAIKDAGAWDDPVERKKLVDAYKKYDREHAQKKGA